LHISNLLGGMTGGTDQATKALVNLFIKIFILNLCLASLRLNVFIRLECVISQLRDPYRPIM